MSEKLEGVVQKDRMDRTLYRVAVEKGHPLDNLPKGTGFSWPYELSEDLYNRLVKTKPVERENLEGPEKLLKRLQDDAQSLPEWEKFKTVCNRNRELSLLGSYRFTEEMLNKIASDPQLQAAVKEVAAAIKQEEQFPDGNAGAVDEAIDRNSTALRGLTRASLGAAKEDTQRAHDAAVYVGGAGVEGPDMGSGASLEEMKKLSQELSAAQVKEFLDLLGAGFIDKIRVARDSRLEQPSYEIVGVELGDDVPNMLPSQLVDLVVPETEDQFYRAYVDKELLQYRLRRNKSRTGGGALVFGDFSGSTGGAVPGDPARRLYSTYIKLLMVAVWRMMKDDERRCELFGFNTSGWATGITEKSDFKEVLQFVSRTESKGGTQPSSALLLGQDALAREDGIHEPDILILSDGGLENRDIPATATRIQALKAHGCNVIAVVPQQAIEDESQRVWLKECAAVLPFPVTGGEATYSKLGESLARVLG